MPTLVARGLPPELVRRVKDYAKAHDIGITVAIQRLLEYAFAAMDARKTAGQARIAQLSPEERSALASKATNTRWNKPPDTE